MQDELRIATEQSGGIDAQIQRVGGKLGGIGIGPVTCHGGNRGKVRFSMLTPAIKSTQIPRFRKYRHHATLNRTASRLVGSIQHKRRPQSSSTCKASERG
jgi:hypothetical protein